MVPGIQSHPLVLQCAPLFGSMRPIAAATPLMARIIRDACCETLADPFCAFLRLFAVYVNGAVLSELRRIIEDSEIVKEDDKQWAEPNRDGRQEFEVVLGNTHVSFAASPPQSAADQSPKLVYMRQVLADVVHAMFGSQVPGLLADWAALPHQTKCARRRPLANPVQGCVDPFDRKANWIGRALGGLHALSRNTSFRQ
eukprot:1527427-Pleurochrysis_carterae.AAC.3